MPTSVEDRFDDSVYLHESWPARSDLPDCLTEDQVDFIVDTMRDIERL